MFIATASKILVAEENILLLNENPWECHYIYSELPHDVINCCILATWNWYCWFGPEKKPLSKPWMHFPFLLTHSRSPLLTIKIYQCIDTLLNTAKCDTTDKPPTKNVCCGFILHLHLSLFLFLLCCRLFHTDDRRWERAGLQVEK